MIAQPPSPDLSALQAGDPAAFEQLFEAYADRLYRLAFGLLGDPAAAEDVVQEAFLAVVKGIGSFEGRASLGTWLYRVAYNASIDRLRHKPEEPLPADEPDEELETAVLPRAFVDWDLTPEQMLANAEVRQHLEQAIRTLPAGLQAVFLLRDVEGLSTEQAAEALGLSISATKVRLHRARLSLREVLADYFGERLARRGKEA